MTLTLKLYYWKSTRCAWDLSQRREKPFMNPLSCLSNTISSGKKELRLQPDVIQICLLYICAVEKISQFFLTNFTFYLLQFICCIIRLLKKWDNLASFIIYFQSFQTIIITIFTTNICEKMSIQYMVRCWELNPRPLEHDPHPITTRPRL